MGSMGILLVTTPNYALYVLTEIIRRPEICIFLQQNKIKIYVSNPVIPDSI